MSNFIISGIQQLGVGIPDVHEAFKWYRQNFGVDIPVVDDNGTAALMLPYTGNEPQQRHAILAINIQGGGGMEIWQLKTRKPKEPEFMIEAGDLGIFAGKIKCKDVAATYLLFKNKGLDVISPISKSPDGTEHFFVEDPYGNYFQIIKAENWFKETDCLTGGAYGAFIGVSDMERSKKFYSEILGYDEVVYEKEGIFPDLSEIIGGEKRLHRVLLRHKKPREGAFSRLLGPSQIELIRAIDRVPRKIFENRIWGDQGFIHLCFDIRNMEELKKFCIEKGHPFTVDSNPDMGSFDMGDAAGHFTYIEDPDGTLIEFVETHKLPILKKIGWYMNLRKRKPTKTLPDWMLRTLAWSRVKE